MDHPSSRQLRPRWRLGRDVLRPVRRCDRGYGNGGEDGLTSERCAGVSWQAKDLAWSAGTVVACERNGRAKYHW